MTTSEALERVASIADRQMDAAERLGAAIRYGRELAARRTDELAEAELEAAIARANAEDYERNGW